MKSPSISRARKKCFLLQNMRWYLQIHAPIRWLFAELLIPLVSACWFISDRDLHNKSFSRLLLQVLLWLQCDKSIIKAFHARFSLNAIADGPTINHQSISVQRIQGFWSYGCLFNMKCISLLLSEIKSGMRYFSCSIWFICILICNDWSQYHYETEYFWDIPMRNWIVDCSLRDSRTNPQWYRFQYSQCYSSSIHYLEYHKGYQTTWAWQSINRHLGR